MNRWGSERGAAAVEFALVVPVLLLIMLAIMEFGRAYNVQISLTHAAREAARHMAVHKDAADAATAGVVAAPSIGLSKTDVGFSTGTCPARTDVHVTITYNLPTITGIGGEMELTGKAAMRCGG